MQPVDRLHGCGRVLERGIRQRPLGDVDQQPEAVGHVLLERPLQCEHDPLRDVVVLQLVRLAGHLEQRRAGGDELPERRHHVQPAVRLGGRFHQRVVGDVGDDA